jgi:enterochelin esterase-like enzyme
MRRASATLATIAAVLALAAGAVAAGAGDQLPKRLDNGAQGSPGNAQTPGHIAPAAACHNVRSRAGSEIVRVLPRGPVLRNGSLAFTSGVCVYLPPHYATSRLRYPVIYLLHGGGGDQSDWVVWGHLQAIMDAAYARHPGRAAIVAMPDGTPVAQWFDGFDGRVLNQQYMLRWVIPFMDRHFRTIADRRGRAIDGLSNGGFGAMLLAAKRPDLFAAAGSMSGNLAWLAFDGGVAIGLPRAPWYYHGNTPLDLASNLDGVDLVMDIGTSCHRDITIDGCAAFHFEQLFVPANRVFVAALSRVRHVGAISYRETEGGHAWRWWTKWFRQRQLPFLLARLAAPVSARLPTRASPPRFPFRYRSVSRHINVYGYTVTVSRRANEFLDLRHVTPGGLTLRGSGRVVLSTARVYQPGRQYRLAVAGIHTTLERADRAGRLRIVVYLGPSHRYDQFSPPANALQAARGAGYWTTRTLTIRAVSLALPGRSHP